MPGFDGTGPMGRGPMTGGGRGYCNPASAGDLPPRNYYRRPFAGRSAFSNAGAVGEVEALKAEIKTLKEQLADLEARIK